MTLKGKKILITGGTGLIGSHLIEHLSAYDNELVTVVHKRPVPSDVDFSHVEITRGDLTNYGDCLRATKDVDYVFHVAAYVGGNGLMASEPGSVMTPNLVMTSNLLKAAVECGVESFLYTSSNCVYPDKADVLEEEFGLQGEPPRAHRSFSWVKRIGEVQAKAYSEEYGLKVAIVRPGNSYGPRDNFDLRTSHAVAALIRKAVERVDPYVVWGSGDACRDFIHASDVARGMVLALEKYTKADPLNLACGTCVTIRELVSIILEIAGFRDTIIKYDTSEPEGQKRRMLSVRKAREMIGFFPKMSLHDGLSGTMAWYKQHKE